MVTSTPNPGFLFSPNSIIYAAGIAANPTVATALTMVAIDKTPPSMVFKENQSPIMGGP